MKKISILMMVTLVFLAIVACDDNQESQDGKDQESLKDVTVVLDWTPNTNHTGLYVALEKGYFEAEGLNVEIIQPSNGTADQLVAAERAQFGVSYQESVTLARLEDIPVVSIAAVIQNNTSGFASLASKEIVSPKDFEGRSYGGWGSPIEVAMLQALMEKDGGDFDQVEILTSGATDFFASSEKGVDFAWIFEGWTAIEGELNGYDLNYISLKEWDEALNYYTPVLITSEGIINENPELVESFMAAVSKGYNFAIETPDQAGKILLKHAPELDEDLVLKSQEFLAAEYQAEATQWGIQKESVWTDYQNWLFERDLIEALIDVDKAYTNEFLPKAE
jgi:ABC-type nitrate/sulfonate/bicarbonate transport system substrate-binding protein